MSPRATILEAARSVVGAKFKWEHPLYLVHSLTARCNARCGFCAWNPEFYDPKEQLSTEAIKQLYTDARAAGFLGLSIWGGEPLLHPDFTDIARHAHELGLVTHMVTNGFLLERKMDAIVPYLDRICISLDHPSSAHDEVRGIKGLFDKIVAGTKELRKLAPKKQIVFIYTLHKNNSDVASIQQMNALMQELGALVVYNGLREETAVADPDSKISHWAASQEQLLEAFTEISAAKKRGAPILNSQTHIKMMQKGPPEYRCHWPKFMLPIEANGDVVDCMHWGTRPMANLRTMPLAEVLKLPRVHALAGAEGEACHKCVSIHRVEISEVWRGNLEPLLSWRMLGQTQQPGAC